MQSTTATERRRLRQIAVGPFSAIKARNGSRVTFVPGVGPMCAWYYPHWVALQDVLATRA